MRRSRRRRWRRSHSCSARRVCHPRTPIRSRASPSTTRSPKRSTRFRWCTSRSRRKFSPGSAALCVREAGLSPPLAVPADPIGERRFLHRSCGDREHAHRAIDVVNDEPVPVQREEKLEGDECYALVAVHERMVRREAIGVGGGELGGVGFAVGGPVQRAREGRIEQARIADAGTAAVLGELLVVRGENDGALDPDPLPHFASSRSTARRFLAMRRTCFICAAKRGSWGVSRRPSGVSVTCSVSPLSTFRRASMSFGRITPTELPIRVSLRAAMVGSNVITSVIIPRPFAGFKSRLGHDDPPGAAAGFRAGGYPVNAISSCDDPKAYPDAIITIYTHR